MKSKKEFNPFDLSGMFASEAMEDSFGFTIDSSFIQGQTSKQKNTSNRKKKFLLTRRRGIESSSYEPVLSDMRNPYNDIF